jgi:hypothetical protein
MNLINQYKQAAIRNSNKKNESNEQIKTNAKAATKLNQNQNYLNLVKNTRQGSPSLARMLSRNGRFG